MRSIASALSLCTVFMMGCGEAEESVDAEISVEPGWSAGESWTVDAEPTLVLGTASGSVEQIFHEVRVVRQLGRTVVVGDEGTTALRFYSLEGELLHSFGGPGSGPREFRRLDGLWRVGQGRLLVADPLNRKVVVVDTAGQFVEAQTIPTSETGLYTIVDRFEDGGLVIGRWTSAEPHLEPGLVVPDSVYWSVSYPGATEPITSAAKRRKYLHEWQGSYAVGAVTFTAAAEGAARSTEWIVADGDDFILRAYEKDGSGPRRFGRVWTPRVVSDDMAERYVAWRLDEASGSIDTEGWRRVLSEAPVSEHLPATSDVLVDSEGFIWVAHYRLPWTPERTWSVFDSAGTWLGEVGTPSGVEVKDITEEYVVGVKLDDLNVERVVLHQIFR